MSEKAVFLKLLQELKIDKTSALDETSWQKLKEELIFIFEQIRGDHERLQGMSDLAYQEMQQLADLIHEREILTESIFNSSQDIIAILDSEGQITEFNRPLEVLLSSSRKEVLGQSLFKFLRDGSLLSSLRKCFSPHEENFHQEFLGKVHEGSLITSSGKKVFASLYLSRIPSKQSYVYAAYIKDLTAEKELEKALSEAKSQFVIASKMSALGEMAGGVAHEINTPLAVIQMRTDQLLECLREDPLDRETALSAISAVDQTIQRISKIVNGLRSFARDGSNDPMSSCSISKIIDDTFSLCREKFNNNGVQLDYLSAGDFEIECRPGEISQVLLNFLNNAYDAIQNCSDKWVKIEAQEVWNYIQINIVDSGSGIPAEIQEKMMQPFFTTKEVGKGTGLGLSISKGIIENHKGRIQIDGSCKNTKFMIFLPKAESTEKAG
jgi:PAS domain S-box-containing protein